MHVPFPGYSQYLVVRYVVIMRAALLLILFCQWGRKLQASVKQINIVVFWILIQNLQECKNTKVSAMFSLNAKLMISR